MRLFSFVHIFASLFCVFRASFRTHREAPSAAELFSAHTSPPRVRPTAAPAGPATMAMRAITATASRSHTIPFFYVSPFFRVSHFYSLQCLGEYVLWIRY